MLGARTAAAADHVHQATLGKLTYDVRHLFGRLVILAEFVGQTRRSGKR